MSYEQSAPVIDLPLGAAFRLTLAVAAVHVLAVSAILLSGLSLPVRAAAATVVAGCALTAVPFGVWSSSLRATAF